MVVQRGEGVGRSSFEPVKALVRGLDRHPNQHPSNAVHGAPPDSDVWGVGEPLTNMPGQ